MIKEYKIIPKEEKENKKYKELIKEAYSRIEEAISHISYGHKFIDSNNFKVNELIIKKLEDIMYDLEDLEDATIYKPVKVED